MEYGILGPLEVRHEGRLLDLGRPKQRAVLAVLLLSPNRVVSLDRLVELLWGEEAPVRAVGALQAYISNLRRVLEPARVARHPAQVLVTQPPGYVLRVGPDELDADRFEALAAEGHRLRADGRPAAARDALAKALALWRGPALAEFAFEPFAQAEAARLEEARAEAVEEQLAAALDLGAHAQVVGELEAAVAARPLRERLWGLLMVALYRSGRQGEALRAYGRARKLLAEEMGIDPSPALRRLESDILAHSPALDWTPPVEETTTRVAAPAGNSAAAVAEATPAPTAARPDAAPFLGRDEPLEALDAAFAQARAGTGHLVLVSGEPGIGKTRLIEEFVSRASGALVARGQGYEGEGAPPFWPWVQVIRELAAKADPDAARQALASGMSEIAQIVPELKELMGDVPPPPPLDPAGARFRLYEALANFLIRLASFQPVIVVIDDFQWVDLASLQLTQFLASRLQRGRLLLACCYRDVDPPPTDALTETLGVMARQPVLVRIPLTGLTHVEVALFMTHSAGSAPSPDVAHAVWSRTDGNPFFVSELARFLAGRDPLVSERMAVPAAVRDVIRLRLSRLPERTNVLLALAAVTGRDFDLRVVATAAGVDEEEALQLIEPAVANGMVVEDETEVGLYSFSHGLVQEAIYGGLAALRRAQLHGRVAGAIEQLSDDDAHVTELAYHYSLAAPATGPEPAISYALRAAQEAQARLAYEQAEQHLRRAVELVDRIPAGPDRWRRELEAHHRLAALLSLTKGYHAREVIEAWSRAREVCTRLDDPPRVLGSMWGLARAARARAQLRLSWDLGEEMLAIGGGDPESPFTVAGHEVCGVAAHYMGDLAASAEHLLAVLRSPELPPGVGGTGTVVTDPVVVARAYLAVTRWLLGHPEEGEALNEESIRLAHASGQPLDVAIAMIMATELGVLKGEPDQAIAFAEDVMRAASGAAGFLAIMARAARAWGRAHLGEASAAAECSQALLELEATGWRVNWTFFLSLLADTYRLVGNTEGALVVVGEALTEVEATGERYYEAELLRMRGEILATRGLDWAEEAEASIRRAMAVAEQQGAPPFHRRAAEALARLALPQAPGASTT